MKTVITADPAEAAAFIRSGGLVAFPTETVYGLGADAFNETAVLKIFDAKGRPQDNPLIVHVADHGQIDLLTLSITAAARILIDTFFPGPLTVVFRRSANVTDPVSAGLSTVGIRMPANTFSRTFLHRCNTPVAAPSANLSGRPSPTTWQAVAEDLDGRIDCILQGEATSIGLESTVVDCSSYTPLVLRPGAISLEDLRQVLPSVTVFVGSDSDAALSPGMKHRHYSPRARVVIVAAGLLSKAVEDAGYIGSHVPELPFRLVRKCSGVVEYAHALFEFFRECDRAGVSVIYCEAVGESGIGAAVMDRVRRAAED